MRNSPGLHLVLVLCVMVGCEDVDLYSEKAPPDPAPSLELRSTTAPSPEAGPTGWTEISYRAERNLLTDETTYDLNFHGRVGRKPNQILMNEPHFELVRVIDQDGRDLTKSQPPARRSGRDYMRWDAQLFDWFQGRNRRADGPTLDVSLQLQDLKRRPQHIRELVAEAVVDMVRERTSKTFDLQAAMEKPVEIAEGVEVWAERSESSSRYATLTLRFRIRDQAWDRRDHPIILGASLLDAKGRVLDDSSGSGRTHERGFETEFRIRTSDENQPPAQVRLTLTPKVERRKLTLTGRDLPVP